MIEVEVKVPVENMKMIKEALLHEGFKYQTTVIETDTYFDSAHYDMRKHDKALRIRTTENLDNGMIAAQLNCKGPKLDHVSMTRKEIELEIKNPEKMKEILIELEFYPVSVEVKKTRTYYTKENITAVTDQVENLGNFLELEILVREETEREAGLEVIRGMMQRLGCDWNEAVQKSYLSMLEKVTMMN